MKSLFLLAAVCCLVLSAWASPVPRAEDDKEVAVARQAAPAAPAAASDDDDDEDDEDDDDDDGVGDLAPDLGNLFVLFIEIEFEKLFGIKILIQELNVIWN